MSLGEFELIKKYFCQNDRGTGIELGIGDDCALLNLPENKTLAVTTDTQIEGIHFFPNTSPYYVGYKSLLVNLSDLAAMGAKPYCFTLSVTLPEADEDFLKEFSKGLFSLASKVNIPLIGGNTTKGELSITISAYGLVDKGRALRRDKAKVNDDIYVTGTLGLPGLAVELGYKNLCLDKVIDGKDAFSYCYEKSMLIHDRCEFAHKLVNYSDCALDISDGLVGDLKHILERSCVGARIDVEKLPKPCEFSIYNLDEKIQDKLCLYGGGDYELLFTAPVANEDKIMELASTYAVKVSKIGKIKNGTLEILKHGKMYYQNVKSFEHF